MTLSIWLSLSTIGALVVLAVLVYGRLRALEDRVRDTRNLIPARRKYLWEAGEADSE